MLEIKNLTVDIEKKEILKNISLKLAKGELIVLLGSNGGGKTSLCKSIAGLGDFKVKEGKILLNKEDITKLNPQKRYEKGISYMWQKTPSVRGISLKTFLKEKYPEKNEGEIFQMFKEDLEKLDILKFFDRDIHNNLSGGESKRLELFLSTIDRKDRVFLFDEPDSGVDMKNVKRIGEYISNILKDRSNSGILITHSKEILKYLKQTKEITIDNGEIVKGGISK
jgi:Fe-S cluster assembly ATP-binding protein